jgi:hypothetical protein
MIILCSFSTQVIMIHTCVSFGDYVYLIIPLVAILGMGDSSGVIYRHSTLFEEMSAKNSDLSLGL